MSSLQPQTLNPLGENWLGEFSLDIGGMGTSGDDDEARFWRYADWGSNFLLRSFRVGLLETSKGIYTNLQGGGVGRDDQFYLGEISWLGRARLRGSFNGIPRDYARDARTIFTGAGSGTLNLLQAARDAGVERFVQTSTSEVYGNSPDVPFQEDSNLSIGPSSITRWGYAC